MTTGYFSFLLQSLGGAAHGLWCSYNRQGRSDWLRAQPEVVRAHGLRRWGCQKPPLTTDIIYLDFQKAFDKVPHQRLLLKLKAHGIGDSITDCIEQWLTDRRQRVVVDGEVSNWKSVLSGVPQGSVLGPILFLIYINDLDDSITSNLLKFADDTKLFRKVNTDGDKQHLKNDLDRLVKWSEKWQMLFNVG